MLKLLAARPCTPSKGMQDKRPCVNSVNSPGSRRLRRFQQRRPAAAAAAGAGTGGGLPRRQQARRALRLCCDETHLLQPALANLDLNVVEQPAVMWGGIEVCRWP